MDRLKMTTVFMPALQASIFAIYHVPEASPRAEVCRPDGPEMRLSAKRRKFLALDEYRVTISTLILIYILMPEGQI